MASASPDLCCSIDPASVSQSTRLSWCQANLNTCTEICGGQGSLASGGNQCDSNTLEYTCKCRNGTEPDLGEYAQTIPSLECNQWKSNCVSAGGSTQECTSVLCGNKVAGEVELSTSDSNPAPSSTPAPDPSPTTTDKNILSGLPSISPNNPTKSPNSSSIRTTTLRESTQTSSSSSNTGSPESQNTTVSGPKDDTFPPSNPSGFSTGTKAGAAIGGLVIVLLLILLAFYIRRRKRMHKARSGIPSHEGLHPSDEKQLAVPIASEISQKAELDSENHVRGHDVPAELDGGQGYGTRSEAYRHGEVGQVVELPSSTGALEMSGEGVGGGVGAGQIAVEGTQGGDQRGSLFGYGGSARMDAEVETRSEPKSEPETKSETKPEPQPEPRPEPESIPESQPQPQPEPERSLAPMAISSKPLSTEEIEALEEEERRLDEEMAEVQRMKELREKKFAVQQKLKEAKRR
ncbi:hypothetical protein GRF29_19g343362 [Pseudopithomyces chartarum]|uniref:DUF7707 domain-containing protein n=1 Tax=Pseudopithomyces chartarum TaxID=1892770 RepID=A0AAN6M5C2_9PLEO|nr:hypothetical protein GRF29_19g343362 [Pseudopithomyces chartarum]